MHGSICHFPSKHFYGNRLENVENLKLLPASSSVWPRPDQRVVWIDCDSPHQQGRVVQVGNSRCLLLHCFSGGGVGEWLVIWQVRKENVKDIFGVAIEMIEALLPHSFGTTWNVLEFLLERRINSY